MRSPRTHPAPAVPGRLQFALLLAVPSALTVVAVLIIHATGRAIEITALVAASAVGWLLAMARTRELARRLGAALAQNAELHRLQSDERFQQLIQNASDVITVLDADLTIRYQTPAVHRVLGYQPDGLVGTSLLGLVHPDDATAAAAAIAADCAEMGGQTTLAGRLRRKDGTYLYAETIVACVATEPRQYVLTTRDITDRKALQDQLKHQAFHDALTGLANRALFVDRLEHALGRRRLADAPLAVLFLDLDDFKTVNDSLGHLHGDDLLAAVGERLRDCLRPSDTPARLGGDEFAVLVEDVADQAAVVAIAERILAALRAPIVLAGQEVVGRASIGIAMVDLDTLPRAEDLLRNAEAAMRVAKGHGKGGHAVFTQSMHAALVHKLVLTAELRNALEQDEFLVHYQPIVDLTDGRIVGVEALLRWQRGDRMVSPAEFIPLAEETGLIVEIGRWVLEEACAQGARWQSSGADPLAVNVNLSLRQLQDPGFTDQVAEILARTGLPASALTLEITESFLAEEGDSVIERLTALKRLGVRLAIDDFGTGYSSLSRLRRFPIDTLKIPKPFIDGILHGTDQSALARTITDLAGTLRLAVVAEGIEEREQWDELRRFACQFGQGFFFARPAAAGDIDALLRLGRLAGPTDQRAQPPHRDSRTA